MSLKGQKKASLGAESTAPEDWHPADILAALSKKNYTMNKLAEEHGLTSGSTLSKCLKASAPISEKRIADAIGVHPMVIWPSRYHENGERKLQGRHAMESTRRVRRLQAKKAALGVVQEAAGDGN